jgi:hypothetical protein
MLVYARFAQFALYIQFDLKFSCGVKETQINIEQETLFCPKYNSAFLVLIFLFIIFYH